MLASEEGDASLAPKLAGLSPGTVRVINRDSVWPRPSWSALIAAATAEATRIGAKTLLIDSLAFWVAFEGDAENNAGAAQAAADALDAACRAGLAVLVVHHQVKSPGRDHGTGLRGSGAIVGAFDVVVEYERLGPEAPANQRRLVALSRFPATPDVLIVDYRREDGSWRVVGEAEGRAGSDLAGIRGRLLAAAPVDAPGATEDELAALVELDKRKIGGPLRSLVGEGLLERDGEGKKGSPYIYAKAAPKAAPAEGGNGSRNAAPPLRGAASNREAARRGGNEGSPPSPTAVPRPSPPVERATPMEFGR